MTSAVASSSTLWAQASKEWVIPAKPKPGRKPKKDVPPPPVDETIEPDSKGRRVQNRAAQRAFRERKQSQLADLQARVQLYEQGEMERNVALQNIAKRLKEENEVLRTENASLRDELRKLRPEKSPETERKRWREDSLTPYAINDTTMRKRIKTDGLPLSPESIPSSAISLVPSPCSMASSPDSDSAASSIQNGPYSPMSYSDASPNPSVYSQQHQQPAMASLFSGFSGKVPGCTNEGRISFDNTFDIVDCGFCSDDTPCMCRELALQQVATRIAVNGDVHGSTPAMANSTTSATSMAPHSPPMVKMESRGSTSINNDSSVLDNLPAYAPPVPLPRRRSADQAPPPSIFPVFPTQSLAPQPLHTTRPSSPTCTGDPSNCSACADDPFGKAFCAALGGSMKECGGCSNSGATRHQFGCAGYVNSGIGGADSQSNTDHGTSSAGVDSRSLASSPAHLSPPRETVPCNTAWAQLKSHPNIAFADLSLLADVVARRSKYMGPRGIVSPGSEIEALTRRQSGGQAVDRGSDDMPVLLTDPHAQYNERSSSNSSAMVVPCGQQRVVEVEAEGVRDALAFLDGQFQRS
ncbi:hypothetical protein BU17DRAFT_51065 [Hysterangium stoloniferum]|nr:hypothetical protein BU17DRAFT_51065 [Hysterangium stoloniferum]